MPELDLQKANRATLKERRVRGLQSNLSHVRLNGDSIGMRVDQSITDANLDRTIDGASTVSLDFHDPDLELLGSDMFEEKFDIELDDLWFRLVAVDRQGTTTGLTFEDRIVHKLKQYKKPVKVLRDKMTRAEFVLWLVQQVDPDIPVVIKELHKVQPIKDTSSKADSPDTGANDRASKAKPGFDDTSGLTVKGLKPNSEQIRNAAVVLGTAAQLGASRKIMESLIVTGIQENNMSNSGQGWFQILPGASMENLKNDLAGATKYYIQQGFTGVSAIEAEKQGKSPAEISSAVEGNLAGASDRYQWEKEAAEWVDAFNGAPGDSSGGGTRTVTKVKPYSFELKKGENAWTCIARLAEEVNWVRFVSAGVFYYCSEEDLAAGPVLMDVRSSTQKGVYDVTFNWDGGKTLSEGSLTAELEDWAAPPGSVIRLGPKFGPGHGKYIVSSISKSLFDNGEGAKVSYKRPAPQLPEPAPETITKTVGGKGGSSGGSGGRASGDAAKFVQWAENSVGKYTDANASQLGYGAGPSVPWCSIFVAYGLVHVCGLKPPPRPAYSGTWIEDNWDGRKISVGSIQPGDLVVFDWGDGGITDHVAIYVGNGMVIGGNQSDAVTKVPFSKGNCVGAARPNFHA